MAEKARARGAHTLGGAGEGVPKERRGKWREGERFVSGKGECVFFLGGETHFRPL